MPAIKFDTTLMRLIKDMQEVRAALRHVTTNLPLYDVANENTPASISTDQNDYVPGNYDVLRIDATANVSITGISGGKKGRFLEIINVGTGRISFPDESASSVAANRIATPYDQTVTLLPNARARFYYDDTQLRWTVADLPNIQGEFGRTASLQETAVDRIIQTMVPGTFYKVIPDTVLTDDWGYWDSADGVFVVPTGQAGLYSLYVNMLFSSQPTGSTDFGQEFYVLKNATVDPGSISGTYLSYSVTPRNDKTGYDGYILSTTMMFLDDADEVVVVVRQTGTGNRQLMTPSVNMPVFVFSKIG